MRVKLHDSLLALFPCRRIIDCLLVAGEPGDQLHQERKRSHSEPEARTAQDESDEVNEQNFRSTLGHDVGTVADKE